MKRSKPRARSDEVPIFRALVAARGFDPDAAGPEAGGRFDGLGIDYQAYEFDWDNVDYYRTPTIREIQEAIPTGAWPVIDGGDRGTSGKRELASP
jgi:hypothetical protein